MLGELKSRFVSMTSHEFRNPLAAILASTETLVQYRDRMDTPQIDLRLDKIQQQVKHLNSIVEDVLNLSRMQSGGIEFKPAPGDLSALCRQVVDDFESQTAHQGRVIYIPVRRHRSSVSMTDAFCAKQLPIWSPMG
ncbi:MAG: HAMP domain-containing sensor histidine kinase [Anaerolineae bacterium]